jgi:hypothetical protein
MTSDPVPLAKYFTATLKDQPSGSLPNHLVYLCHAVDARLAAQAGTIDRLQHEWHVMNAFLADASPKSKQAWERHVKELVDLKAEVAAQAEQLESERAQKIVLRDALTTIVALRQQLAAARQAEKTGALCPQCGFETVTSSVTMEAFASICHERDDALAEVQRLRQQLADAQEQP